MKALMVVAPIVEAILGFFWWVDWQRTSPGTHLIPIIWTVFAIFITVMVLAMLIATSRHSSSFPTTNANHVNPLIHANNQAMRRDLDQMAQLAQEQAWRERYKNNGW